MSCVGTELILIRVCFSPFKKNSNNRFDYLNVVHTAIAFEVPSGLKKEKEAIVLTVLQVLTLCEPF